MYRKLLQNLTIATISLGGLVNAGNMIAGQDLPANRNVLTCATEAPCSAGNERRSSLVNVAAGFSKSGVDVQRLRSVITSDAKAVPASTSTTTDIGSFALTGSQIIEIKDASPTSGHHYADPIVSALFNSVSTAIVVPGHPPTAAGTSNAEDTGSTPSFNLTSPSSFSADHTIGGATTKALTVVNNSIGAPEPGTDLLIGLGLVFAGIAARARRQRNKS